MGYIGNQPFLGAVTGDVVVDGSITAQDLAPGAAVPPQTGNAGKFLTTDGTTASWDAVSEVPTQTGQNGKFLTTDGTVASWDTVSEVPSQSGQAGKYLTTDGTIASWGALSSVRVTGITYPGNDTAVAPAGGQTVTLAGTGFVSTPTVFVNNTIAPSVSFVSSTQITFVTPAFAAGTYHVYVVNPDGATAIFVNGISYSGVPTWTTAAGSLGTYDGALSIQLQATSDSAVTYALTTGSTLPAGITLSSGGLISGTINTEQTFSFSVDAIDAENQDTPRSFSVTISLAEPFFKSNVLLLSGNGTNGAQNNTFLDSSTNAFTITRNGNTTQGTFSPFSQTGWGNYFDGTGDYLETPSNAAFTLGSSGDFTIECWVYLTATSGNYAAFLTTWADALSNYTNRWWVGTNADGILRWYDSSGNTGIVDSVVLTLNTWFHVAVVRSGSTITLYKNGTAIGTQTTNQAYTTQGSVKMGYSGTNSGYYFGYISNARVVKGTAVYTANFTPPTSPLTAITNTSLLTCQSNRFIDNSSNAFAITRNGDVSVQAFSPFNPTASWSAATYGGSGYFDGSGDYLNTTSTQIIPSGSFTVEAWAYLTTTSTGVTVVAQGTSGNGARFSLGIEGGLWWAQIGSATINAGTPVTNTWTHLAVTFNGSTLTLYVNGTSVGTASTSTNAQNTTLRIGSLGPVDWSTYYWPGYIGQVRISNTVRSISVPTALYTADANTTFLANFTNAGIYDATSKNDLETVGNAQISTTQSKFGGSSMYFDGAGDYLVGPWNPLTDLGAGDFTIEFWMYPTAVGQSSVTYLFYIGTNGNYAPILIGQAVSGYGIVLYSSSTGSSWNLASGSSFGTATANAWNHVALTRYGADVRLFLNGVVGTTLNWGTTALLTGSSHKPNIGSATGVANTYYTGYMQDLRVTKGIARYTSNFTPPTAAHKLR